MQIESRKEIDLNQKTKLTHENVI